MHHFGDVGLGTTLVDDGQIATQLLGQSACAYHASNVRRHDDQVFVILLTQIAQQDGRSVDVVDRNVEKALNLVSVQIHGQHTRHTHSLQHVGHHLGGDWHTCGAGATVLASVAEIGDHGADALGRCTLERINHDQQFHEIVVRRSASGLHYEDIASTDVLFDFDGDFTVREATHIGCAQLGA